MVDVYNTVTLYRIVWMTKEFDIEIMYRFFLYWGRFKNTYELLNLRALNFLTHE